MNSSCPICAEPCGRAGNPYFPFCSERCQLVDLGRWLNEDYRIPGEPADEDSGDESSPDDVH
jgi:hypothetical protein